MPLSTTASFPAGLDTWQAIDFTVDHLGDDGVELDLYVKKITNVLDRVMAKVGIDNSAVMGSLDFMANSQLDKAVMNVQDFGVLPAASSAVNTFVFNVTAGSATYNHPVAWYFPPGTYNNNGLAISRNNHTLECGAGIFGATITYQGAGTAGQMVSFTGSTSGGYNGRISGGGIRHMKLINGAAEDNRSIKVRHCTGMVFEYLMIQVFRGDGAVEASNFADSMFFHCDWQFCASIDDSDKPVIKFWHDGNGVWAVDQITFLRCKFEVNGDRLLDFRSDTGSNLYINKIWFTLCKFESSGDESYKLGGSTGANGAQIWLDSCQDVSFDRCDFTLQEMRLGHAILPTIFRLKGTTTVHCNGVTFNIGSGSAPKCFTNFYILDGAAQLLVLVDVWVNSGNSTAFPTDVIQVSNSPVVVYTCVGFTPNQGSGKTAGDWINGTTANTAGGAGGGVIA